MATHGVSFVTGFVYKFVVVPCSTQVIASGLTYAATTKSIIKGTFLLFVYAGVPLIIIGSFMGWLGVLNYFDRHRKVINNLTSATHVAMGACLHGEHKRNYYLNGGGRVFTDSCED